MSAAVKGTFASGQSVGVGQTSAPLVIPSGVTQMKLSLGGVIDVNNTVKTQKSTTSGQVWIDQTTYNAAQVNTVVAVADGEHWRLQLVTQQAIKAMDYELSVQS